LVRLAEIEHTTRNGDINNHFAEHHLQTNHRIDWDSAKCIRERSLFRAGRGWMILGRGYGFLGSAGGGVRWNIHREKRRVTRNQ